MLLNNNIGKTRSATVRPSVALLRCRRKPLPRGISIFSRKICPVQWHAPKSLVVIEFCKLTFYSYPTYPTTQFQLSGISFAMFEKWFQKQGCPSCGSRLIYGNKNLYNDVIIFFIHKKTVVIV